MSFSVYKGVFCGFAFGEDGEDLFVFMDKDFK